MIDDNTQSPKDLEGDVNYRLRNQDYDYLAHVVGTALIAGALIISASVIYSFKTVGKQLSGTATVASSQNTVAQAPSQPSAAAQPLAPAAPGVPVNIKLAANTPYLGSGTAKVTVVEYADYRCPFCERLFTTVLPDIKSKYIDTGEIKFIYQDFAFLGADSNTAAEASHCAADQNKFWQYHDYLFKNQGSESGDWASAVNEKIFAKTLGLNTTQFNSCLDSGKYKQEVLNETAAGKSYGVTGTPTVFVNGVAVVGAQPLTAFTSAIDAALKK